MSDVSELIADMKESRKAKDLIFYRMPFTMVDEVIAALESQQSTVSRLREALTEARPYVQRHLTASNACDKGILVKIDEALKDIQSMKDGK